MTNFPFFLLPPFLYIIRTHYGHAADSRRPNCNFDLLFPSKTELKMQTDSINGFHESFPKLFLNFSSSSSYYYYFNSFLFTLLSSSLLVLQASAADSSIINGDLHRLLSFKSSLPNSSSLLQDWSSTTTNNP